MFFGLQAVLNFRVNPDDEDERNIVDMLWIKFYNLCREQNDAEMAYIAATSISDEAKRETSLGSLVEDLVDQDNLSRLFKCRMSNKNLTIVSNYLKKRMKECLGKVLDNSLGEDLTYFKADKIFIKLLKSLNALYNFYTKPREICQYMLNIFYLLQDYKFASHSKIYFILEIEQILLSLILLITKTFDNPEKYIFYIKENDIYNILKRKSDNKDVMMEVPEDLNLTLLGRVFAVNTDEGKYTIKLKDLEAYQSKNEAQICVYNYWNEFIGDLSELIDFLIFFHQYDFALHLSIKHNHDPTEVIKNMVFKYWELNPENEDEEELKFEDATYAWMVDEIDASFTQKASLLRLIIDTVKGMKEEYPNLNRAVLEVLLAKSSILADIPQPDIDWLLKGIKESDDLFEIYHKLE
jgi:hypothetical protein